MVRVGVRVSFRVRVNSTGMVLYQSYKTGYSNLQL